MTEVHALKMALKLWDFSCKNVGKKTVLLEPLLTVLVFPFELVLPKVYGLKLKILWDILLRAEIHI